MQCQENEENLDSFTFPTLLQSMAVRVWRGQGDIRSREEFRQELNEALNKWEDDAIFIFHKFVLP